MKFPTSGKQHLKETLSVDVKLSDIEAAGLSS